MGQEQSKGKTTSERVAEEPVEYVDPVVKEQKMKEERARRAAAAEQRMAQQKGGAKKVGASTAASTTKKKPTLLEQVSIENRGHRAADQQAEVMRWD